MIDEMTAEQVRSHAAWSPAEIRERMHALALPRSAAAPRPGADAGDAVQARAPVEGRWTFGYLVDTIMNRDYWMHRVDLARATGPEMVLTADHDGRIVADVVAEWAQHAQPFTLVLGGPAGGTFVHGAGARNWSSTPSSSAVCSRAAPRGPDCSIRRFRSDVDDCR